MERNKPLAWKTNNFRWNESVSVCVCLLNELRLDELRLPMTEHDINVSASRLCHELWNGNGSEPHIHLVCIWKTLLFLSNSKIYIATWMFSFFWWSKIMNMSKKQKAYIETQYCSQWTCSREKFSSLFFLSTPQLGIFTLDAFCLLQSFTSCLRCYRIELITKKKSNKKKAWFTAYEITYIISIVNNSKILFHYALEKFFIFQCIDDNIH